MNYVGVDIHKKYSVLCALDESGRKLPREESKAIAQQGLRSFLPVWKGQAKPSLKHAGIGA